MDLEAVTCLPDQDRFPHRIRRPERASGGGAELEAVAGPANRFGVPRRARLEAIPELHPAGRHVRAPAVAGFAVTHAPAKLRARPRVLDRDPGEVFRRIEEADPTDLERGMRRAQLPFLPRGRAPDGDPPYPDVHVRSPTCPLTLPDQPRLRAEREGLIDHLRLPPPVRAQTHRPEAAVVEHVPGLGLAVFFAGQVIAGGLAGDLVPPARDLQKMPIPEPPTELGDRLVPCEAPRVLKALGGVEVRGYERRSVLGDSASEVSGERFHIEGTDREREQRARSARHRAPRRDRQHTPGARSSPGGRLGTRVERHARDPLERDLPQIPLGGQRVPRGHSVDDDLDSSRVTGRPREKCRRSTTTQILTEEQRLALQHVQQAERSAPEEGVARDLEGGMRARPGNGVGVEQAVGEDLDRLRERQRVGGVQGVAQPGEPRVLADEWRDRNRIRGRQGIGERQGVRRDRLLRRQRGGGKEKRAGDPGASREEAGGHRPRS